MEIPAVQTVYDYCAQSSGNRYARDLASVMRQALGDGTKLYRIGTAKFAIIVASVEAVEWASKVLRPAFDRCVTILPRGAVLGTEAPSTLDALLAAHPHPFDLEVRLRLGP